MRWGSRRGAATAALVVAGMAGGLTATVAVARSASGAQPATTKFSERFDGRSGNASYVASVFVASQPRRSEFVIGFRQGSCSDGAHYSSAVAPLRNQGFTISPSGQAAFSGYYAHAYAFDRHGKTVHGHEHFRVTMQFTGSTVSGVVMDRFTSPRLHCHSGQVHFIAWRDGTSQAPLDTSWGSTGHYAGTSASGEKMGMNVFLPLGLVMHLTVKFRASLFCTGGLELVRPDVFVFQYLRISGGRFHFSGHDAYTKGGFRDVEHYSISAARLTTVRWTYVVRSYQGGRHLGTCTTPAGGDTFYLKPPRGHSV